MESGRQLAGESEAPVRYAGARRPLAYAELHHLPPAGMVLLAALGFTAAASQGLPPIGRLLPFMGSILLTQLSIAYHNDYCDRKLDALTKPWRPIPSGLISPRLALSLSLALFCLGLLAAAPLGLSVVAMVAFGTAAGFVYNWRLKRTAWSWLPFWIALPTLAVCAFTVVGRFTSSLGLAYVVGLPIALSIYLADSLPDIESDARQGIRGAAHRLGPRGARLVCWGSLVLSDALALALWPRDRSPGLLFLLSLGLLGLAVILGWRRPSRPHFLAVTAAAILLSLDWLIATSAFGS